MLTVAPQATFSQVLTEVQYRAWPPNPIYPPGLVATIADAVLARKTVLIVGDSDTGKSTLQLAALRSAAERVRVVYVDKNFWTRTSQRDVGAIDVIHNSARLPETFNVLGFYELRLCDHKTYVARGQPTICDDHIAPLLVRAARAGAGTATTFPVAGAIATPILLGWIEDCYPDLAQLATRAVTITRDWPTSTFTYSLWSIAS